MKFAIPKATRAAGDYYSGSYAIPGNVTRLRVTSNIDPADRTDPAKSGKVVIETQLPDTSWVHWGGFGWAGVPGLTRQSQITIPAPPPGTNMRAVVRGETTLNMGALVEGL